MEGSLIGSYRVVGKLGEGGMGVVYVAEHQLLGRRAAIKVLLPAMSANQQVVTRFFNEARAVTAIADPGIVQVFDFGFQPDGSAYIVMELLEGETLDARLRRRGPFSVADSLRLIRQVATSLAAAHARGVVHRDLKPDNVFVTGDPAVTGGERPKILDFGIAKLSGDDPGRHMTQTGMLIGTPVYMSPEQCRGAGNIDHRSDLYSLGCVLFTMIAGRPPFDQGGSGEVIAAHLKETPPLLSQLVPGIPAELDTLLARCLAKDAADRPQSALELADALGYLEGELLGLPPGHLAAPEKRPMPRSLTPVPAARNSASSSASGSSPAFGASPHAVTTFASAAGQRHSQLVPPARRRGTWIAVGAMGAAAIGIAAFVALARSGAAGSSDEERSEGHPPRAAAPAVSAPSPVPAAAPPAASPARPPSSAPPPPPPLPSSPTVAGTPAAPPVTPPTPLPPEAPATATAAAEPAATAATTAITATNPPATRAASPKKPPRVTRAPNKPARSESPEGASDGSSKPMDRGD